MFVSAVCYPSRAESSQRHAVHLLLFLLFSQILFATDFAVSCLTQGVFCHHCRGCYFFTRPNMAPAVIELLRAKTLVSHRCSLSAQRPCLLDCSCERLAFSLFFFFLFFAFTRNVCVLRAASCPHSVVTRAAFPINCLDSMS